MRAEDLARNSAKNPVNPVQDKHKDTVYEIVFNYLLDQGIKYPHTDAGIADRKARIRMPWKSKLVDKVRQKIGVYYTADAIRNSYCNYERYERYREKREAYARSKSETETTSAAAPKRPLRLVAVEELLKRQRTEAQRALAPDVVMAAAPETHPTPAPTVSAPLLPAALITVTIRYVPVVQRPNGQFSLLMEAPRGPAGFPTAATSPAYHHRGRLFDYPPNNLDGYEEEDKPTHEDATLHGNGCR